MKSTYSTQSEGDSQAGLEAAGQALFRLGRIFARQPLPHLLAQRTERAVELSRILVAEAVAAGEQTGQEITVGAVAERLAIDPSTASRLVAETIQAGYLTRSPAPEDARRSLLALTEAGRELVEHARRYQRAVFEQATAAWPAEDRQTFARLLVLFTDSIAELHKTRG
ncbi:MAG TPA: MarR family transcriptional regulator [Roseiflexaceae bacterium]|nr:MarR family transcriptional regulator [Roseiflexaceae bacterium]